jgi:hypothetical protein
MGARILEAHRLYFIDNGLGTALNLRAESRTVKFRAHLSDIGGKIHRQDRRQHTRCD